MTPTYGEEEPRRPTSATPGNPSSLPVMIAPKDGADTIGDTVRSAASQCDVSVVSNGSTDDPAELERRGSAPTFDWEEDIGEPNATYKAGQVTGRANGHGGQVASGTRREPARGARPSRHVRRARGARLGSWFPLVPRTLMLADVVAVVAAFQVTRFVVGLGGRSYTLSSLRHMMLLVGGWIVLAGLYGLYSRDQIRAGQTTPDDAVGLFHAVIIDVLLVFLLAPVLADGQLPALHGLVLGANLFVAVYAGRLITRAWCRRRTGFGQRTVVLGSDDVGQEVARRLTRRPGLGVHLVGFVDPSTRPPPPVLAGVPVLGSLADLPRVVRDHAVERVIVAFSRDSHVGLLDALDELADLNIRVDVVPRLFEVVDPGTVVHHLEGMPLMALPWGRPARAALLIKRTLDVVFSALLLLLLAAPLVGIAILIKLDSPGPVLFRSERIGRDRRTIRVLKFRTMRHPPDEEDFLAWLVADPIRHEEFLRTHKLASDPRVTRLGSILRRFSLDELPQLTNILRGELSIVGPRPVTLDEWRLLWSEPDPPVRIFPGTDGLQHRVSGYWDVPDLRPGLTGYWQITGRSDLGYEERVQLDRAYGRGWSLRLDLAILAKTVGVVTSRRGAK
jgi:exopolysaccharide biosynthesis polyprenyl glycosylphosphotransferase